MTIAGINDANREKALDFIKYMAKEMSYQNTDGLGYSAITNDNKLFGERWLNNREAFETREPLSETEANILKEYFPFFVKEIKYNSFGDGEMEDNLQKISAIALHTRMATSSKQFYNTHPFVENETTLIHNGVINNHDKILKGKKRQSSCDSEALLRLYTDHNVAKKPSNIQQISDRVEGYYACAVIARDKQNQFFVDVFKDGRADLSAAFIKGLNLIVITTKLQDVVDVVRKMPGVEIQIETTFTVNYGCLIRMNPVTGKVIKIQKFDPYKKHREAKKEEKKEKETTVIEVFTREHPADKWNREKIEEYKSESKGSNIPIQCDTGASDRFPGLHMLQSMDKEFMWDDYSRGWRKVNKKK
jgi:hypothetical protein